MNYQSRFYREYDSTSRWKGFRVKVDTTDLLIRADCDLSDLAEKTVRSLRRDILQWISIQEEFLFSLEPVPELPGAPEIVKMMVRASETAGVGPMASIAGAIAELTGRVLGEFSREVIVENGGDIWMTLIDPAMVNLFSGGVHFPQGIFFQIRPDQTPCGICTSSGKLGHSLSFGKADAATVIAWDAALADAAATALGNRVHSPDDMKEALSGIMSLTGIRAAAVVCRGNLGVSGEIELANPFTEKRHGIENCPACI